MQPKQVISHTPYQIDLLILGRRKEVRALERINRNTDLLAKKTGKPACRTFSDQNPHDLMPFIRQFLAKRKRLGQVTTSFTLYDKQYFHITSA